MQIISFQSNNLRILITLLALLTGAIFHPACAAPLKSGQIYGTSALQTLDVYSQKDSELSPVIVYVHGGAWQFGSRRAVGAMPDYFTENGFVFVSLDYRLVPKVTVDEQLQDIDAALGWVQKNISRFGGDPTNIHLFGHSAGAHLVTMTAVRPLANAQALLAGGAIRSVISNDTLTYDIAAIAAKTRRGELHKVYKPAFGTDPANWQALSPASFVNSHSKHPAFLLLHSGKRLTEPRHTAAKDFAARLKLGGTPVTLFNGQTLDHMEINNGVGTDPALTRAISQFLTQYR